MSTPFQFKQFEVQQNLSAMKVGTDGVLLGAWLSPVDGNLLDVGCGTGLLSLMMAQRVSEVFIDAIDIEEGAYLQTVANVEKSKWKDKINVFHSSVQQFQPSKKYDLIFSNPPYFINSSKALDRNRNTARHNDTLSSKDLIKAVKENLKKDGIFGLILPVLEGEQFIVQAVEKELHLIRKCEVKPNLTKDPKRLLMEFSYCRQKLVEEELIIETEKRHHYTEEYKSLTNEFYLKFK